MIFLCNPYHAVNGRIHYQGLYKMYQAFGDTSTVDMRVKLMEVLWHQDRTALQFRNETVGLEARSTEGAHDGSLKKLIELVLCPASVVTDKCADESHTAPRSMNHPD
ncbi:hypothetical protein L208DRAFT_681059 [Tricholoma matsutake]|nr:hypothetical protein L208DRAFT_681059 [Tricholoma matsutake 945]